MRALIPALLVLAASVQTPGAAPAQSGDSVVRPGIEVFLSDLPAAVRGKRVGLITNHIGNRPVEDVRTSI